MTLDLSRYIVWTQVEASTSGVNQLLHIGMNSSLFPTGQCHDGLSTLRILGTSVQDPSSVFTEVEPTLDAQVNMILGSGVLLPMEGFDIPIQFGYVPDLDDKWIFTMSTGIHYTF